MRPPALLLSKPLLHCAKALTVSLALGLVPLSATAQEGSQPADQELGEESADTPSLNTLRMINPGERIALPDPVPGPVLRFVVADDFPPFAFIDGAGRLAGVHIDLIRAICDTLELPCTLQARRFDRVLDAVDEDRDTLILAAGLAIDETTLEQFAFSLPYYRYAARFAAQRDTDLGENWLQDATIGVLENTAHAAFLRQGYTDAAVETFPNKQALYRALMGGDITHVFGDGLDLAFWLPSPDAEDCCTYVDQPIFSRRYFGEGLAFAVPTGQPRVVQALNAALQRLEESGELETIMLTSFPLDPFGP